MKKIANHCAVQTLLFTVSYSQKIRIVNCYKDRETWKDVETVLYEGTEGDFSMNYVPKGISQYEVEHCKVRGLDIVDGVLVISINTIEERKEDGE